MARPRIFVSSTFYDLKHVRASLDVFVRSLGFESVLSEKGDIAYSFDRPLDESCYAEVNNADIFVLLVGGRYGSAASDQELPTDSKSFFERYESITKKEYARAAELDIPIYVLMDKSVNSEYQTFKANRDNQGVRYVHVDSVNVFELIDDIMNRPRNNPMQTFEKFTEVEEWLREQWAGLFRDLLKRAGQQEQIRALNDQIAGLREINETLRTYMETVVSSVAPDRSVELIDTESRRLDTATRYRAAMRSPVLQQLATDLGLQSQDVIDAVLDAKDVTDLRERLRRAADPEIFDMLTDLKHGVVGLLEDPSEAIDDSEVVSECNSIRKILGVQPLTRRDGRRPPPPPIKVKYSHTSSKQ